MSSNETLRGLRSLLDEWRRGEHELFDEQAIALEDAIATLAPVPATGEERPALHIDSLHVEHAGVKIAPPASTREGERDFAREIVERIEGSAAPVSPEAGTCAKCGEVPGPFGACLCRAILAGIFRQRGLPSPARACLA